jgi:hypothetical protein
MYRSTGLAILIGLFNEEVISVSNCLNLIEQLLSIPLPNIPREEHIQGKSVQRNVDQEIEFLEYIEATHRQFEDLRMIENLPSFPPVFIMSEYSDDCGLLFFC